MRALLDVWVLAARKHAEALFAVVPGVLVVIPQAVQILVPARACTHGTRKWAQPAMRLALDLKRLAVRELALS